MKNASKLNEAEQFDMDCDVAYVCECTTMDNLFRLTGKYKMSPSEIMDRYATFRDNVEYMKEIHVDIKEALDEDHAETEAWLENMKNLPPPPPPKTIEEQCHDMWKEPIPDGAWQYCSECSSVVMLESVHNGIAMVWHGICTECRNVEAYGEPEGYSNGR